jgi:hypothetical protein
MDSKGWMVAAALLAAGTAQATCYSVHKADGSLILETSSAPVNLTLPFGDTVPEKFGQGAFMVMSDSRVFCKERRVVQESQEVVAAAPVKKAPEVKAEEAVEHQPTDEELLALKPEVLEPTAPVQPVEVKVLEPAGGTPVREAVKAQQMGAGKLVVRGE